MKTCAAGRPESIEIPAPARMKYRGRARVTARRRARRSLPRTEATRRLPCIDGPPARPPGVQVRAGEALHRFALEEPAVRLDDATSAPGRSGLLIAPLRVAETPAAS